MNKDELKSRVIKRSYEMFARRGIKGVTMDSIAQELSISKRTLYEMFSSKAKLLTSIIETINDQQAISAEKVLVEDISSLEKIFYMAFTNKERETYEELLFVDLIENYPKLLASVIASKVDGNVKRLFTCMDMAVVEGYVDAAINIEIPVHLLLASSLALHSHGMSDDIKLTTIEAHIYSVIFFLRSVATPTGIEEIDRLSEIHNINIYKKPLDC